MPYKKEYHTRYMRKWRERNPDKEKESQIKSNKKRKEYFAKWFQKNKERYKESRQEYYQKNKEYFKQKSRESYLRNKERIAEKARILRREVINAYGGKCTCCGESTIQFLAIDHVKNDGVSHRKQIRQNKIYKWAKQNKYPKNLQILCHNCNLAKSLYGRCPHNDRVKS
jgi:5-methylcytosine-specific restriction endonuclease McrA